MLPPSQAANPIWITGAGGLIGGCLVQSAPAYWPNTVVVGLRRADLDLTDAAAVRREFERLRPRLIIHCAAVTKPTDCEADPVLAQRLNVEATATLAGLAEDIPLVFFSTDLVFDGRTGGYEESAAVNPLNRYAETKVAAERRVLANPRHTVIRTSINGGTSSTGDRAFNEQLRRAWQEGRVLELFTDEFRCPIPASVTARAVWELIAFDRPGLYHVAGSERLSRWQIGQLLAARWPQWHPRIAPASLKDYAGPPRAADTSLNCAKAQQALSFPLPGLSRWLAENPCERF